MKNFTNFAIGSFFSLFIFSCGKNETKQNSPNSNVAENAIPSCHSQISLESSKRVPLNELNFQSSSKGTWEMTSGEWIYNSKRKIQNTSLVSSIRLDIVPSSSKKYSAKIGCNNTSELQDQDLTYSFGVISLMAENQGIKSIGHVKINPAKQNAYLKTTSIPNWKALRLSVARYMRGESFFNGTQDEESEIVFDSREYFQISPNEIAIRSIRKDNEYGEREIIAIQILQLK